MKENAAGLLKKREKLGVQCSSVQDRSIRSERSKVFNLFNGVQFYLF